MKIPDTYEEYKSLNEKELFQLGWMDFDEITQNKILQFVKKSMIEEKIKRSISEDQLKNIELKNIIYEDNENE